MKRFLPWIGIAVASPTVLFAVFMLRSRETVLIYSKAHSATGYDKSAWITENSWQVKAVDKVRSLLGLRPLASSRGVGSGTVDAREVPCLDDQAVVAALGIAENTSVIVRVGQGSAGENELVKSAMYLDTHHDFLAFIIIDVNEAGKAEKQMRFAFDQQRKLVATYTEDQQTGAIVIDASGAGETPHREFQAHTKTSR